MTEEKEFNDLINKKLIELMQEHENSLVIKKGLDLKIEACKVLLDLPVFRNKKKK